MFHHHKKTQEEDGEYNQPQVYGEYNQPQVYTEESGYAEQNAYGQANNEGYNGHRNRQQEEYSTGEGYGYNREERRHEVEGEVKENRRHQHMGTVGALGAGAYALYERHEAKKDPEHAFRHNAEAGIGAAMSVGSAGYAIHEHHDQKKAKDTYEQLEEPEKKHWYN